MRNYIQVKSTGSTPAVSDIDISTVADNEILLVVTEGTGLAFTLASDDWEGTAEVTIDWGDGVTETSPLDGAHEHYHSNGGVVSMQGYKKWKVRIYNAGANITSFKASHTMESVNIAQISPILEANIGAAGITDYSWAFNNSIIAPLLQRCIIKSFDNCVSAQGMFRYATALLNISLPTSWGLVEDASEFASGCSSLTSITLPAIMSDMISASSAFKNCSSLKTINNFGSLGSLSRQCNFTDALNYALGQTSIVIGSLIFKLGIYGSATKRLCTESLRLSNPGSLFGGTTPQINVSYTSMNATALNLLFGDLPTLVGKTINITGCPGAATCLRSIATAKGWTVTG